MGYIPTPHQLKARHATRRLSKKVVELCGRRASQEIDVPSFRRSKRRFYLDLDKMNRMVHRRLCDGSVTEQFYRLEKRLVDRLMNELTYREEMKVQDGYYGYELKIRRNRPYVRGMRRPCYEYATGRCAE